MLKCANHEKLKHLTEAISITISDRILEAQIDDQVSDEEYSLRLSELDKFYKIKDVIRSKISWS